MTLSQNSRAKPQTHLSDNFPSEDALEWAVKNQGLSFAEAEHEAIGFRNYWISEGKPKADWMATWRNRIWNAKRQGRVGGGMTKFNGTGPPNQSQKDNAAFAQALEMLRRNEGRLL